MIGVRNYLSGKLSFSKLCYRPNKLQMKASYMHNLALIERIFMRLIEILFKI